MDPFREWLRSVPDQPVIERLRMTAPAEAVADCFRELPATALLDPLLGRVGCCRVVATLPSLWVRGDARHTELRWGTQSWQGEVPLIEALGTLVAAAPSRRAASDFAHGAVLALWRHPGGYAGEGCFFEAFLVFDTIKTAWRLHVAPLADAKRSAALLRELDRRLAPLARCFEPPPESRSPCWLRLPERQFGLSDDGALASLAFPSIFEASFGEAEGALCWLGLDGRVVLRPGRLIQGARPEPVAVAAQPS